ncbi:MAG: hypothetical protein HDR71_08765 [Lachnospiraceae bacterium]|nr:hypothetical protein [Lachnospiraceae bacterium]
MNYTELLNKLLDESGLQQKEILIRCKELGEEITQSYLSNLKTINGKTASEKISKVIAKACNAKYEDILTVQAYIDKAPKPILDFFNYAKDTATTEAILFLKEQKDNLPEYEFKKMIQEKEEEFQKESLAEFICERITDMTLPTMEGFKEQLELIKKSAENYGSKELYAIIPINKDKPIRYLTEEEMSHIQEKASGSVC